MNVERLVLGPLETNTWLVDDGSGGPVVVIDPADEPQVILEALRGRPVAAVVLTHGHFDHLGAVNDVLDAVAAPLLVHEADAASIVDSQGTGGAMFGFADHHTRPADRVLRDGEEVEAGNVRLTVIHTPGHTPGSISLFAEGELFSGDTLFAGSVGRTDFPGGDPRAMRDSIVTGLAPLPDETRVHPGHGPDTSIARERRLNPFFPRG